jgi:hypothetical protein
MNLAFFEVVIDLIFHKVGTGKHFIYPTEPAGTDRLVLNKPVETGENRPV